MLAPLSITGSRNGPKTRNGWCDQSKRLRRTLCASWASRLGNQELARWAESDLLWERITNIETLGVEDVFDICIPGASNFVANGIVSHNSGDIESDADVCVMLYQDAYYNDDSYAKGFAEAIVRKHRDGPCGTAWLIFVPEYARFRDFTGQPPRAPAVQRAPSSGTVRSVDFKKQAAGDDGA